MMNLAPILVSVYTRKQHFINCIDALSNNRLAKESILYIVSDAGINSEDNEIVNDIRNYILTIKGFKEIRPILRQTNFGAHESIFQAINFVLDKHGKIICLEDDIMTSVNFLEYMNGALDAYENDERIITITGYAPPFKIPWFYKKDVWVNRRQCAWGFATWKDKWNEINFDEYNRYLELISNPKNIKKYVEDGEDLFYILKSDSYGDYQALDIRICYHQYLYDKLTVYPVISKINNAGFDGSGLRCKISDEYHVNLDTGNRIMKFPKDISQSYLLKLIAKSFYDSKPIILLAFPLLNTINKKLLIIKNLIHIK